MTDDRQNKIDALNAVVGVGQTWLNFDVWPVLPSVLVVSEWAEDWQASWEAAAKARDNDDPALADQILADSVRRLDTMIEV